MVKRVALWTLGILLAIPCIPFVCWGIFSIAWGVAELCCERYSNPYEMVMFGISMGTIPAVQLSIAAGLFWRDRKRQRRLFEQSLAVRDAGMATLPNFGETLGILQKLGVVHDEFVADLVAVDQANAHLILDKLAKDPEHATQLAKMNTRQRTAELTRLSIAGAMTDRVGATLH